MDFPRGEGIELQELQRMPVSTLPPPAYTLRAADAQPVDALPADTPPESRQPKCKVVILLMLLSAVISLDAMSFAIALPAIVSQIEDPSLLSPLLSSAVMLGSILLLSFGLSDSKIAFTRMWLCISIGIFVYGATMFTIATTSNTLVLFIARLMQGIGTGGLWAFTEAVLANITSVEERHKYVGSIALAQGIGLMVGSCFGAVFTELSSWRWLGCCYIMGMAVAFVLSLFIELGSHTTKASQLDWIGVILGMGGIVSSAWSLRYTRQPVSWSKPDTWTSPSIAVMFLIGFVLFEKGLPNPIMPYRIFSNAATIATLIGGFAYGLILHTILVYQPIFFQAVFLYDIWSITTLMVMLTLFIAIFSSAAPGVIKKTGKGHLIVAIAWLVLAVAGILPGKVGQGSAWLIYSLQPVLGASLGLLFGGTRFSIRASVSNDNADRAEGVLLVFQALSALFGLVLTSSSFVSYIKGSIALLGFSGSLSDDVKSLVEWNQVVGFIPKLRTLELPDETINGLIQVYHEAFNRVWLFVAYFAYAGFITSCCAGRGRIFKKLNKIFNKVRGRVQGQVHDQGQDQGPDHGPDHGQDHGHDHGLLDPVFGIGQALVN